MSKILIGIAALTSGLALVISMSASASSMEASGDMTQEFRAVDKSKRPLQLNTNSEITESEMPNRSRFPLMLPQPTKTEGQNTYDLG
jgi:hypothetical protein